jgi:bisphosphoglycerate-dependent phosphoglycerate mutase
MLELVIVRHGESVRNHASDLAHHGDTSLLEYQLRFERDEAAWDMTQRGVDQAKMAGTWIRSNIGTDFSSRFVSPRLPAKF